MNQRVCTLLQQVLRMDFGSGIHRLIDASRLLALRRARNLTHKEAPRREQDLRFLESGYHYAKLGAGIIRNNSAAHFDPCDTIDEKDAHSGRGLSAGQIYVRTAKLDPRTGLIEQTLGFIWVSYNLNRL